MGLAILIMSRLLKRKGLPADNSIDYALVVLPCAIIGARIYFLLFPYDYVTYEQFLASWTWSNFWAIRNGGLGIYGGVILAYVGAFILCKAKKQKFFEVADCAMPGLFLGQALGRWGNFINGEAFGNLITNPSLQWFPYAVQVDGSWYQATFFYESMCTLLGFVICLLLLRNKHYRDGWLAAFYGIYYGIVRLVIEGMRSDSLFLKVPILWEGRFWETGIKVSQAVSILIIVLGALKLILMYRKDVIGLFKGKPKEQA